MPRLQEAGGVEINDSKDAGENSPAFYVILQFVSYKKSDHQRIRGASG